MAAQIDTGVGELRALVDILRTTVDKLDATMASRGQTYPSLDSAYTADSEAPRNAPDVLALCDVLVNAAGTYPARPLLQMTPADWDRVQAVNVRAPMALTVACANALIAAGRPGAVVNICGYTWKR